MRNVRTHPIAKIINHTRLLFAALLLAGVPATAQASPYVEVVERTAERIVVEWTAPELSWDAISVDQKTYVLPQLGELQRWREPGFPQLPYDALTLAAQPEAMTITVLDSVYETRSVQRIAPAPTIQFAKNAERAQPLFLEKEIYSNDAFFPTQVIETSSASQSGNSFVRVQIHPLQYNAVQGRVRVLRFLRIEISAPSSISPMPPTFQTSRTRLERARQHAVTARLGDASQRTTASTTVSAAESITSPTGLKLQILNEGVYQVTGAELAELGVSLAAIDPNALSLSNRGERVPLQTIGMQDGQWDPADQVLFFAERLSGTDEFYHAYTDTNVYWLTWDGTAGPRFVAADSSAAGEPIQYTYMETRHFEEDKNYYHGDSNRDIQNTDRVDGEGWLWDSAVDPGELFQTTFDLPGVVVSSDSARLRFRVRGETLDSVSPSHQIKVTLNNTVVYEGTFDDREELIADAVIPRAVLKEGENLFALQSVRSADSAVKSRFYFDWFEITYERRMTAVDGFLRLSLDSSSPTQTLWVQGFESPQVTIWAPEHALEIPPSSGSGQLVDVTVRSAGAQDGNVAQFLLNGENVFAGARGINLVALQATTGRLLATRSFDTYAQAQQSDSLAAFINSLSTGTVVLAAVRDDGANQLKAPAIQALQSIGSQEIVNLSYRDSWACIGKIGASAPLAEQRLPAGAGGVELSSLITFTESDSTFHVQFSPPDGVTELVVFDQTQVRSVDRLHYMDENPVASFSGADYIILTHQNFIDAAQRLAAYRSSHNGFRSVVYDVESVYNAFSYGIPDAEALRDFLAMAYEISSPKPAFVLLFGDANWDAKGNSNNSGNTNFVPTLGNPVSDALLACLDGPDDILPDISIGRIPVKTAAEAEAAVDKIVEYENAPSAAWKKNFLFISGGFDELEQQQFKSQSHYLADTFVHQPPTFGRPIHITKEEEQNQGDQRSLILDAINTGAMWVNFIGHAASRTWELMFNNPDIDDLSNKGRYPFISSMTCHTGRFAEPGQESFSERFLLVPDKGAIGFWGTSGWGYSYEDFQYLKQLYPTVLSDTVRYAGDIISLTKFKVWQYLGSTDHYRNLILQYNLLGDPALTLGLPDKPDLAVRSQDISTIPQTPSESDSTAVVNVAVHNWGLLPPDSSDVHVTIEHPIKSLRLSRRAKIGPVGLVDTTSFSWPLRNMAGLVSLTADVDPFDRIAEFDETNNRQETQVTVLTSDIQQVSPLPHAMVPQNQVVLKVQTPQRNFDDRQRYIFELDTSRTFDSPAFQTSPPVRNHPLLVRWQPEGLDVDQRYFWRVRSVEFTPPYAFESSFYVTGTTEFGWQQSAPHQEGNVFSQTQTTPQGMQLQWHDIPMLLQSSRTEQVGYALIEVANQSVMTTRRGHNFAVLHPHSGAVLQTGHFDTYGNPDAAAQLVQFIDDIPTGHLVLGAVNEEGSRNLTETVYQALESIGSAQGRDIAYRYAWAILGRKGAQIGSVPEGLQPPGGEAVILRDTLSARFDAGLVLSETIGPAQAWHDAELAVDVPDSTAFQISVIGYESGSGDTTTLVRSSDTRLDLSAIDGRQYPKLALRGEFTSQNGRHSPLLREWKVSYDPVPDVAVSPLLFTQSADSITVGESIDLFFDVYNIGLATVDSVNVFIEHSHTDGEKVLYKSWNLESILPDKYQPVRVAWASENKPAGTYQLLITLDPERQIPELSKANNTIVSSVYVHPDTLRPEIKLTFDDREIFDGDLVSAQPRIVAKLYDNKPQPIVDTTRVAVFLDGWQVPFQNATTLTLQESSEPEVRGVLTFTPELSDGEHVLEIQVTDDSRNLTTQKLSFVVESDLMLRNVLNYPNPLQDHTEFSFELSQQAEVTIKCFTVAGRLIRTLHPGRLPVGYNRVGWDARDADGDVLANGVYIYTVSARNDNGTVTSTNKLIVMQ